MDGENTCRNKQIFCRSDKSLISPIIMLQQQMSTLPPCFHFSATQRMPFRDLFPWQIMRIRCLAIMFIRRTLRVRSLATLFPANTAPCACVHSHFILFIVFSHIAAGISQYKGVTHSSRGKVVYVCITAYTQTPLSSPQRAAWPCIISGWK